MPRLIPLFATLAVACGASQAATVYSQNFESGSAGTAWTGAGTVQSTAGLSAFGFGAQHLRNDTDVASVLTISGLGAHSALTLSFDLALWDSIDGNPGSFPYGDLFQVSADGSFLVNQLFGNYGTPDGLSMGPGTVITQNGANLGYSGFVDSARAVSITFAHSASSVSFSFAFPNSQGGSDESFGLDNVLVSANAVPEPGTYAMMALGLAGVAVAARRRAR